ncbi:MAG: hypothetical protein MJE77_25005 [Proteobacteria bacterium]|nr:hypothetical protein [Pseudomonadota bacterium]
MSKPGNDTKSTSVVARKPVVTSVIGFGIDFAERGVNTSFDLMQEVRTEIKTVSDATIGYADNVVKTAFDLMRSVSNRVDQLANVSLDQGRATILDIVNAARSTGDRASEFAAGTVTSLVSDKVKAA